MNWLKKFWITFVAFLPLSAGAFWPITILGGGTVGIIGYSIFRSVSPVNLGDALSFFSACWSCRMFSDVVTRLSQILPQTYTYLGKVMIPFAIALTAVWFAWQLLYIYIGPNDKNKQFSGWSISGKLGTHITKLLFVIALLSVPLPRMISSIAIEPIFNVGLSLNYTVADKEARANYTSCIIATALTDSNEIQNYNMEQNFNAFSPRFRHNLTCQIANVHQMTGLGITIGWTMLSMAFNYDNMHKIMWGIPIFPNVPLGALGLLILVLYFAALLPVPLYFLEIFVKLSIDFILLPLTLLGWLFNGWSVFPAGKDNIKQTIDDVVSGVLGLALTGIFITFSIMVLNKVFGTWSGASLLETAIANNDSKMLINGLLENTGQTALVTIILLGIFMAMFMVMIPTLIKSIFNVTISDKYAETAFKDVKTLWSSVKKFWNSGQN